MTVEKRMEFGFTYDRDFIRGFYESQWLYERTSWNT